MASNDAEALALLLPAAARRGQGLAAGDLVGSGTCTGMAGQRLHARFGAACEVVPDLR